MPVKQTIKCLQAVDVTALAARQGPQFPAPFVGLIGDILAEGDVAFRRDHHLINRQMALNDSIF